MEAPRAWLNIDTDQASCDEYHSPFAGKSGNANRSQSSVYIATKWFAITKLWLSSDPCCGCWSQAQTCWSAAYFTTKITCAVWPLNCVAT